MYLNELINILNAGFLVKTCYGERDEWQYNIVQSIYKDNIVLLVRDNVQAINQLMNRPIFIKATFPDYEFSAEGKIVDAEASTPININVKLVKADKYPNRRHFYRYLSNLGCNIKSAGESIGAFALVKNISYTGLYLTTQFDHYPLSLIKLDILSDDNTVISLNGEIIRQDKSENYTGLGIIFKNNNHPVMQQLKEFLSRLEDFQSSLLNEWARERTISVTEPSSGMKVLIVDDIKFTRSFIRSIIQSSGITEIEEASNGNEAVQKASVYYPDIITLDISMPGIDGIQVLEHIRKLNSHSQVIVISAYIDDYSKQRLKSLGVKHFIPKPFEQSQLSDVIKKYQMEA